jgi:DNA polymerase III delta prime subunit
MHDQHPETISPLRPGSGVVPGSQFVVGTGSPHPRTLFRSLSCDHLKAYVPTTRNVEGIFMTKHHDTPTPLDSLIHRMPTTATWEDLVLPEPTQRALHEIAQCVHQTRLPSDGALSQLQAGTKGTLALFAGPTGTGKTMAAQVLARYLAMELWRIDLSTVASKYIGETEKNLDRVFKAAEASGAVLLLEEADALFGKRSGVRDANDRYANVEVSYLLQRAEEHVGVVILTCNHKQNIDAAFMRRLRYVIEFSRPNRELRHELWRRVFSPQIRLTEDVNFADLTTLKLSGAEIRNIAERATLRAATNDTPVSMSLIEEAAMDEMRKLGIPGG